MKIGNRFGKLVVVEEPFRKKYPSGGQSSLFVKCKCDCGVEKIIHIGHLKCGHTKSCGCNRIANSKFKIGDRFGKLVTIDNPYRKKINSSSQRVSVVLCKCDCGVEKEFRTAHLLSSNGTKGCGCGRKLTLGESSFNNLFYSYKHNCKSRGYSFELTKEQFKTLTKSNCYYCGIEPKMITPTVNHKNRRNNGVDIYNGVDRIDNAKGYTLKNAVSCCKMCNLFKNKYTKQQFLAHVDQIYAHQHSWHLQNNL